MTIQSFLGIALGAATLCAAVPAPACSDAPTALATHYVRTGLYRVDGAGGNSLLRLSAQGVIVVDGKPAASYAALRKAARKLSELPVRVVVATDAAPERSGTHAQFIAAGADVVAHENAALRTRARDGAAAAPTRTFRDTLDLDLGAVPARALHFGAAHGDGDAVVYFPDLKVVAVGALFNADEDPEPAQGGDLRGWSQALGAILRLDFTLAVPATGAPVDRAAIEAFKARIDARLAHGAAQLAAH